MSKIYEQNIEARVLQDENIPLLDILKPTEDSHGGHHTPLDSLNPRHSLDAEHPEVGDDSTAIRSAESHTPSLDSRGRRHLAAQSNGHSAEMNIEEGGTALGHSALSMERELFLRENGYGGVLSMLCRAEIL